MMKPTVYTRGTGTNCQINGEPGQVTGIVYSRGINQRPESVFIHMHIMGMIHATLGLPVGVGDTHHEIDSYRHINRDEFDRLNDLHDLRTELGWRA